ncbi:MAG: hypothetical protein HC904_05465 [Blastochloris sp.]|nr:hypothetical protein [Blastochloris sp.]
MSRTQILILNVLAVFFLLLTGTRYLLLQDVERHRRELQLSQALVVQAKQSEQVLRQIILRLAQSSQREPDLKDLLKQYNITIGPSVPSVSPQPGVSAAPKP